MAYDDRVADRVRSALKRRKGIITERKMFGGLSFLLNGHMCCGVLGKELVLRLGKEGADRALDERHTREMDFTGVPLSSMVYVRPAGFRSEEDLKKWIGKACAYARSLPPK